MSHFDVFRSVVRRHTGMVLGPEKDYFIEARLAPLAQFEGVRLDSLADALRDDPDGPLGRRAAEAMLVSETSFFRDPTMFEGLRLRVLPALIEARRPARRLDLWSAACCTGQEPYSLALLLHEHFPELAGWDVRIFASDVSASSLDAARRGVYTQPEVNRGLPARLLVKHFERLGLDWRVSDAIRARVRFEQLNLLAPLPALPPMDLVLLRNVLIYFDTETKRQVLSRIRERLRTHSRLVLGGAETTVYLDERFAPCDGGIAYQPGDLPHAPQ